MIKIFKPIVSMMKPPVNCGCGCGSAHPDCYRLGLRDGADAYFNE